MPSHIFESSSDQKPEEKREEKMSESGHINPSREKALKNAAKSFQSQLESGVIIKYTEEDVVKSAYQQLHKGSYRDRPYPVEYERDIKQLREDYEVLVRQNPQSQTSMESLPELKETREFWWQKD